MIDLTPIKEARGAFAFQKHDDHVSFIYEHQYFAVASEKLRDGGVVLHLKRFDEVIAHVIIGSNPPDIARVFGDLLGLTRTADRLFEGSDTYAITVRFP